ncbi:amidohydrolase family protein [Porcipelethomonas sp.]|uniref:amidohydrolase family protein n=1 Tax=Porcipelethomonas sp. TaxID=2981675 RepID=UPI003EF0E9D0
MFIDFHTHAFSDKIVKKAMSSLEGTSGIKPHTDGTVKGMLELMDKNGIDKSVLLPIATKPSQQTVVNNWAKEVMSDRIYPFGSVHPDAPDAEKEIERIKEMGLYGIKLHPDYQNFYTSDKKIYPILQKCSDLGLMVVFHAGYDPLSPDDLHSTPADYAAIHKDFPDLTMILAHLGGMYRWEQTERYLAGKDGRLFFDISFIAGEIGTSILSRIIKKHGADRILLASDCPWDNPVNEIKMIENLDIPAEDKEKIFFRNAAGLLNIKI